MYDIVPGRTVHNNVFVKCMHAKLLCNKHSSVGRTGMITNIHNCKHVHNSCTLYKNMRTQMVYMIAIYKHV